MRLNETLRRMRQRRPSLNETQNQLLNGPDLLESCIPSYCHPNWIASFVAWSRLTAALDMAKSYPSPLPILDFGAGSGELLEALAPEGKYFFVERSEELAAHILRKPHGAARLGLADLPESFFGTIFCLDSLEHNTDYPDILRRLWRAMHRDGTLILSGPTENFLYRAGRLLAGFSGHYHEANVFDIETELGKLGEKVFRQLTPFGLPFFAVSAWRKRADVS